MILTELQWNSHAGWNLKPPALTNVENEITRSLFLNFSRGSFVSSARCYGEVCGWPQSFYVESSACRRSMLFTINVSESWSWWNLFKKILSVVACWVKWSGSQHRTIHSIDDDLIWLKTGSAIVQHWSLQGRLRDATVAKKFLSWHHGSQPNPYPIYSQDWTEKFIVICSRS